MLHLLWEEFFDMALGIFMIVFACIFAFMSGFLVDKDAGYIPLGLSAILCTAFGILVLGGVI